MRDQIIRLHSIYCNETGLHVGLDTARERDWYDWLKRLAPTSSPTLSPTSSIRIDKVSDKGGRESSPEQALRLVIAHLQRGIREQKRNPGALKFRNLIGMPDYFEEDLAEARAQARGAQSKVQSPKSKVLQATGRTATEPDRAARTPAQIMAADQAFAEFRKLKDTL